MEVVLAVISVGGSTLVAIIGGFVTIKQAKIAAMMEKEKKNQAEEKDRIDKRAEQRAQESLLLMRLMNADTKLTVGVAMALKRGHANGEIEEGLDAVKKAQEEYQLFNDKLAAKCKTC